MQDNHEGFNRSRGSKDRGASDAKTNSGISGTNRAFARQLDEIEGLLDLHFGALNTGGLNGHSPALDREGEGNNAGEEENNAGEEEINAGEEENNAGKDERNDDAVTDTERDSEQQCNEMDPMDRESLFDSPTMRKRMEQLVTALVKSHQKLYPSIERDCGTEDGPPYDDDPGKDLNAKVEAFREEVEELRHEVEVFKAWLKEANEIMGRISKAPRTNKVEILARLKEAIEKVRRIAREIEKAAAIVGDN